MKLELKHIAPYLPYGLKVTKNSNYYDFGLCENNIETLICLSNTNVYTEIDDYSIDDCLIHLHPLSSLTKEIEINGERFNPIERLKELCLVDFEYIDDANIRSIRYPTKVILLSIGNEIMGECQLEIYQQLIEWKFDVSNLIENKLAIPVTKELNPYK